MQIWLCYPCTWKHLLCAQRKPKSSGITLSTGIQPQTTLSILFLFSPYSTSYTSASPIFFLPFLLNIPYTSMPQNTWWFLYLKYHNLPLLSHGSLVIFKTQVHKSPLWSLPQFWKKLNTISVCSQNTFF